MTEQQPYDVLARFPDFELRRYPAHLIAEVEVDGSFADAGNRAFGLLVGFISGRNTARAKVAMTAPVVQEAAPRRISMTSPVLQQQADAPGRHVVSFVMPAGYTIDTLPEPTDRRIAVREVPTQLAAARTFTGRWTEESYRGHLTTLRNATQAAGFEVAATPRFARFDPPWTPWFLRRNEVVLPVGDPASTDPRTRPIAGRPAA